ncbi:MAG: Monooxygenase FAD-binding [Modestobacter sp.]|nr:Monooxygenase FAD-binding [Modestobacter sp.]
MPRTAEIAGAGLSGLVLGSRLAQLGWDVRLHERNPELRMFGAGIWIWESGLRTLETLGAYDQATARARSIKEWRIADQNGRPLMSRFTTPSDRLLLPPRADLYEALIAQAQKLGVQIETSSLATGATADGTLQMEDGRELKADLVVAADGAYSRLRESISSTSWMDFGTEAGIRMMIDREPGDPDDTIIEYWHGPRRLLYNPCTEGQDYIFLSAPVSDERAAQVPVDRELWAEQFPRAAHLVERFAEASRWDRLVNVRCRHWSRGHVAVVGDAAHAMPPNLGQAANTAFINAMALAATLDQERDVPTALARWEKENRALTDHVQWWSYLYGFVVGKCPERMSGVRARVLKTVSGTKQFQTGLNKGARHVPAGARTTATIPT